MRHRIAWRSKTTGETGHGRWHATSEDLADTVAAANKVWPELHHWIETEPSWTEIDTSTEDTEIVDGPLDVNASIGDHIDT